jgi:UDP-GlcNAc:undecaprenyl-phosphate GlcNAc-1-phosphate transferase
MLAIDSLAPDNRHPQDFLLVFVAALLLAALLTPISAGISRRLNVIAEPGGRRRHAGRVPKLGGIAVVIAFFGAAALAWYLMPPSPPIANPDDASLLQGVLWGSFFMAIVGLVDDVFELPPVALFALQFVAVAIAFQHEIFIQRFTLPVVGPVTIPWTEHLWAAILLFTITSLWIVGMVNTVNFLDGLDGLAAGVGTIAALLFALHGYRLGQSTVAAFPLALAGALLGFLPFNFAPARVFLGSVGAYFLGFSLATMSILSPAKIATALLVLAVPILDVAWQIVNRIRQGQSPFRGDRGHLHFRLLDFGLPTRQIVVGYYLVALTFGLAAIFAPSPLSKLVILLLLSGVVFFVMFWLARRSQP